MKDYAAAVVSGVCAILLVGLGLPLANRRVPPNRWYGYRVSRYQFEEEEIWYEINAQGGLRMFFCGLFCAFYAAFSLLFAGSPGVQSFLTALLGIFLLAWAACEVFWSIRAARRMARERGLLKKDCTRGS